jgi:hypothetical protein
MDLALLEKIKITDFTMKDKVIWGNAMFKKKIAQQLEEVYPQAVNKSSGYISDDYDFAANVEKTETGYLVTMNKPMKCAMSSKVRLELAHKGTVEAEISNVLNDQQFEVISETDLCTGTLLVYGIYVEDLRTVDYDAISMLNVSATQELANQLKAVQAKNKELTDQVNVMKAQIDEINRFPGMTSQK